MAEGSELERRVGSPALLAYVGSIGALSQGLYGERGLAAWLVLAEGLGSGCWCRLPRMCDFVCGCGGGW